MASLRLGCAVLFSPRHSNSLTTGVDGSCFWSTLYRVPTSVQNTAFWNWCRWNVWRVYAISNGIWSRKYWRELAGNDDGLESTLVPKPCSFWRVKLNDREETIGVLQNMGKRWELRFWMREFRRFCIHYQWIMYKWAKGVICRLWTFHSLVVKEIN